jgi:hypothetical protein
MDPAIVRALTDPRASPGTRAVAQTILQRQMQAAQDQQKRAYELQDRQQQWAREDRKTIEDRNFRREEAKPAQDLAREKFDWEKANKPKGANWSKLDDGRLFNQETGEVKAVPLQPGAIAPATIKAAGELRNEITQRPEFKSYTASAPIYINMVKTAPTDTKASDLNMIYGLGKIMDPGSVVREGELALANGTSGLPDWLVGYAKGLTGNARLQPETRKALMAEAYNRMQAYEQAYQGMTDFYGSIATKNGLPVDQIIPSFVASKPWEPEPAKPTRAQIDEEIRRKTGGR